ncbi:tRNA (adenosine(37)-N6)-dimethylallyltransferase MiaA [Alicyclobacillus cycloheptanicus]|uniref:tRNA dimethylallyltransferase n=1 Tax=Alicyclobacillus cycloheptanicus TaxID=1457 RepID=A0ABT9XG96_9BACL|nr:tRNA (adenosine(37)-N6)-dimethylallyltransferase MiaA [Alicyclobacillus cycloheptanicus]MDQ0189313.1 tRNA dimethylallyltransferase [Alicyclobacillus cycloheptanicus]WDM01326.1 tRNA (adenosine(37)-N6)-dimethylallyltransferase MiaA [Alicyclobacillus cycloheptanicus]
MDEAMANTRPPVLCIVGPTGVGKSDFGILLAKAVGGEIVSADSMQVYRGMDIGTAKLTPAQMQGVPHHLLSIVDPDEPFTAADWTARADRVIADIHRRGKLPIVVGGTGLYIRAIVEDLDFGRQSGSPEIRQRWQAFADAHGKEALHAQLQKIDPDTALRLHPNDVRRVVRALEVAETRGQPLSATYDWRVRGGRYHTVQLGLTVQREVLYERINRRVDHMIALGLVDEVAGLLHAGYPRTLTAMQAIGYKEIAAYVCGEVDLAQAVEDTKRATRRFAKRQLSWFRRDPRIRWMDRSETAGAAEQDAGDALQITMEMAALAAGIPASRLE